MKPKLIIKISIDFVMPLLLLFVMARQLTGDTAHEWLGAGMVICSRENIPLFVSYRQR